MTNPTDRRQAVIDGLRELADFLEQHPDVPKPDWPVLSYHATGTDEQERAEVDRVAAILGVEPHEEADGDHYIAARGFSGVTYRAVAITSEHMRRYNAAQTYADAVEPEEASA